MANREVNLVGGFGHSTNSETTTVIANIGSKGTNFSGTFTGRTAYYAYDFVVTVYTDKDDALHMIHQVGQGDIKLERKSERSFLFKLGDANPVGEVSYDSSSGDLTITGANVWFQGTVSGMYVQGG